MTNRPEHSPNEQSNAQIYAFFEHFLGAAVAAQRRPGLGETHRRISPRRGSHKSAQGRAERR
jgi:hypothetical protein